MNDAPIAAETPIKLKREDLAKPEPPRVVPPSSETPTQAPEKPAFPGDARTALEQIASGPKEEATQAEQATPATQGEPEKPLTTSELDPNKERMDSILTQVSQLLLHTGDPRLAIAAVARQAAPTPLGNELRRDVLTMVGEIRGNNLSPEQQKLLEQLQKDIEGLNLPKTDPARSEFARFLEEFSKEHPNKAIPPASIEAVRTNKLDRAQEITNVLQSDSLLAAKLHEQFKGDRTEPLANVATPDGLLKAAGIAVIPENVAKAEKVLKPPRPPDPKSDRSLLDSVMPTLMTVALVSMFLNQLTGGGEGGGH